LDSPGRASYYLEHDLKGRLGRALQARPTNNLIFLEKMNFMVKPMDKDSPFCYRRRLPHWRQNRAVYFVTWRLHPQQPPLQPQERDIVVAALQHFDRFRYQLLAYVVMDDHIHLIVAPAEGFPLETLVHSWKSFIAYRLQRRFARKGSIWQDEYFDRIIRHETEFQEKLQYIYHNPRKRWPDTEDYPWISWRVPED